MQARFMQVNYGTRKLGKLSIRSAPLRNASRTPEFDAISLGSNLSEVEDHARRHIAFFESVEDLVDGR